MNMQMDADLKKEQIGTLFFLVGAPEGEFRRGGGAGGSSPKIIRAYPRIFFWHLLFYFVFCRNTGERGMFEERGVPAQHEPAI